MKKTFLIIQMLICATICFAQESVTILVSGEGKTKTEATDAALRSAIEQTFGAFVSANTTILNDGIVKDEVATVSSGNIEKYTEVNYFERNGKSYITLNATISIGKLISYAKSKGSSCELAGATLSAEIRKINFYKQNTRKALENLREQLKVLAPTVYDINMQKPKISINGTVEIDVDITANENMDKYENLILTTLRGIAMPFEEQKHLNDLDAKYYTIYFCYFFIEDGCLRAKRQLTTDKYGDYCEYLTDAVSLYDFFDFEEGVRAIFNIVDNLGNNIETIELSYPGYYSHLYEGSCFSVRSSSGNNTTPIAFLYDAQKNRKKMQGKASGCTSINYGCGGWPYSYTTGTSDTGNSKSISKTYDLETLNKITGFTIEMAE